MNEADLILGPKKRVEMPTFSRDLMKKFWAKVDTSDACWEWKAAVRRGGYGVFCVHGKGVSAHRFSYSIVNGSIPDGAFVCHHCDNPKCVRPSHLFLGTNRENILDSMSKGNFDNRGEKSPLAKLTDKDVYEIRRLCSLGVTKSLVAKMWRISHQHTGEIVRRINWRHI